MFWQAIGQKQEAPFNIIYVGNMYKSLKAGCKRYEQRFAIAILEGKR